MGKVPPSTRGNGHVPRSTEKNEQRITKSKRKKKHRPTLPASTGGGSSSSSKPTSSTALRNRIRSLTKLLAHADTMPADVRVDKEREVASLETELAALLAARQRKETLGKYHMVRFVERRKAERALKRWRKAADSVETHARAREAEIDLAYAQNAPLAEKYAALFAEDAAPIDISRAQTVEDALDLIRRAKPPLWTLIEQAMEDGSLPSVRAGMHVGLKPLGLWTGRAGQSGGVGAEEDGSLQGKQVKMKTLSKKRAKHQDGGRVQDKALKASGRHGSKAQAKRADGIQTKQPMAEGTVGPLDEDAEMSDGGFFEM